MSILRRAPHYLPSLCSWKGCRKCISNVLPRLHVSHQKLALPALNHLCTSTYLMREINEPGGEYRLGIIKGRNPLSWLKYNDIVYPPQEDGEDTRPAEICHMRTNIKYSPKKMWYVANMIRGMSIDEAIKQLSFQKRKGCHIVKEVLEEAQELAVRDHNVEFKSNLWIADSKCSQGIIIKGQRKHKGPRFGIVHYRYTHYFVRLQEGTPPEHYYPPEETGNEKLEGYIKEQRQRRILYSL